LNIYGQCVNVEIVSAKSNSAKVDHQELGPQQNPRSSNPIRRVRTFTGGLGDDIDELDEA